MGIMPLLSFAALYLLWKLYPTQNIDDYRIVMSFCLAFILSCTSFSIARREYSFTTRDNKARN